TEVARSARNVALQQHCGVRGSLFELNCNCATHHQISRKRNLVTPSEVTIVQNQGKPKAPTIHCATTLTIARPPRKRPAADGAVPRPEWRTHQEHAETAARVCPQGGCLSRACRNALAQSRTRSDPGNRLGRQRRILGLGDGSLHSPAQGRALHP